MRAPIKQVGKKFYYVFDHFITGKARIIELSDLDSMSIADQWWYDSVEDAVVALDQFTGDGEPQGWFIHPNTGRTRTDEDESQE